MEQQTIDLAMIGYTIRLPRAKLEAWKAGHRRTYPLHGMSFNAWLLSRVDLSFTIQDEAVNPPQ